MMKLTELPQIPPQKLKNKKRKKTPAERNADTLYAEHLLYTKLGDLPGIPFVPMGGYGEDQGYRFLVIERLGRTLETVLQEQGPVPSATAARLGQEILETLQGMHVKNVLYVDVKPENFMLNMGKENQVYCVDFGISDRYVTPMGNHKEYKESAVLVGTPAYLSVSCHNGGASSRRDDIESLLNVLIYLMRGDLPWQYTSSDAEGAKIKKSTSVKELCASLPSEWGKMLESIRACGFEDKPDYEFYAQQFSKLGGRKGLTSPFEWGTRKTSKAASKVVASSDSPSKSPARKRAKSIDMEELKLDDAAAAAPPAKAKPKARAAPAAKRKTTPRNKTGAKKTADLAESSKPKTRKADEESDVDDSNDDDDVRRQDRQVFKAIAGHAAATAAVKRYNLRSSNRN